MNNIDTYMSGVTLFYSDLSRKNWRHQNLTPYLQIYFVNFFSSKTDIVTNMNKNQKKPVNTILLLLMKQSGIAISLNLCNNQRNWYNNCITALHRASFSCCVCLPPNPCLPYNPCVSLHICNGMIFWIWRYFWMYPEAVSFEQYRQSAVILSMIHNTLPNLCSQIKKIR